MTPGLACVILGGGGHAAVLIECLRESDPSLDLCILDPDRTLWGRTVMDVAVVGDDNKLARLVHQGVSHYLVGLGAVGIGTHRQRLYELGREHGLGVLDVRHSSARVSTSATFGAGCQLLTGAIVGTRARIGTNVIINTGAIVEHDCQVGDHTHVATGARLAGAVTIGTAAFIGIGATVREGVRIGAAALVGAGAVVVEDVPPRTVVVGVPARPLRRSTG
jgi:sugar O-acyltransferase (sialic acid O-acetyltransferase NeuD family)